MLLLNAFSINMLANTPALVHIDSIDTLRVVELKNELESAIGHKATANILSDILGVKIPVNRATVKLGQGSHAIVAQYIGPRLDEKATKLPDGSRVEFFLVYIG